MATCFICKRHVALGRVVHSECFNEFACPVCQNEIHLASAKFCMRCGTPLSYRLPYYYEIGRAVEMLLGDEWHKGKIIQGDRTHDGIINVQLEDGRMAWCGEKRYPEFLRDMGEPY